MIKIGIIGMSPGNAHPYSWSAIINGCFDGNEISKVGYPAVSHYLKAGLSNKRLHLWVNWNLPQQWGKKIGSNTVFIFWKHCLHY